MFSDTIPGVMRHHNYPAAPPAISPSLRDQSLEPFMPISYPESSQRTRIRDAQFPSSREEPLSAHHPHLNNNNGVAFSGAEFSPAPIPSDRPPPPPRPPGPNPHSFPHPYFPPNYPTSAPSEPTQPSSPVNRPLNYYHNLSSSLPDSEDEPGHGPDRHHPSNFIPIVPNPEAQATFRATPPSGSFDASEQGSLNSSPRSSTLSPIPPIETIPSQTRLGVSRTRNNSPAKMHICPVCNKEFPRPSGLKTHMNIHNNLRPYTCGFPNCPKTFSVRSNARRHYRIHSGTGPPEPPVQEFRVDFREPEVHRQVTPPPFSLSQAPFRLRWVRPNINSRTAAGANTPLSDSGWGAQEGGNDAQDPEDRAHESMSAYDATDDTDDMYYDNQRSWDAHARSRYPASDE